MKKSYSLLMASVILLSGASTDALANKTTVKTDYLQKGSLPEFNFSLNAFKPEKKKRPITNKVERTELSDISNLEGKWTFIVGDNYFEDGKGFISIDFEATVDDNNYVTFTNPDYFALKAKYNQRTHSVSFFKRQVAQEGESYIYQEPFLYDTETGALTKKSVVAYFNEYERAIVFDDNMGIALSCYADKGGKQLKGYYDILDLTVSYLPMGGEWTDLAGNALFTDGWLAPALLGMESIPTYEVPVQQSADNENVYRLVNPYKYGPLAIDNECEENGYIVIDVTDPSNVIFKFADAGYANKKLRIDNFFAYNYMGSLMLINPYYTPAEVIEEFKNDFPSSTYRDGVVTFDTSMAYSDLRFALQDLAHSPRFWKDAEGNPAVKTAGIVLPGFDNSAGVNGIGTAGENVEYFTPQGIRVVNPEPGQIVIKRQGNTISKEIYK